MPHLAKIDGELRVVLQMLPLLEGIRICGEILEVGEIVEVDQGAAPELPIRARVGVRGEL